MSTKEKTWRGLRRKTHRYRRFYFFLMALLSLLSYYWHQWKWRIATDEWKGETVNRADEYELN